MCHVSNYKNKDTAIQRRAYFRFTKNSPGNFALRLDPDASVRKNSNQPYKTILS